VSRWSYAPIPVETSASPVPSSDSSTLMSVSRRRPAHRRRTRRAPFRRHESASSNRAFSDADRTVNRMCPASARDRLRRSAAQSRAEQPLRQGRRVRRIAGADQQEVRDARVRVEAAYPEARRRGPLARR
jgi:hypothetical protein